MKEFVTQSVYFGVVLSLIAYEVGLLLKRKCRSALVNPLLIAVLFIIGVLLVFRIDYKDYNKGAQYITYFLTPATVSLAIPLYRQLETLKKHPVAIFLSILAGVFSAMGSIFLLALAFGLNHAQYVTLLPKSITTAIGMGVSEKMGGIVTLTVVAISISGISGNIMAESVLKIFLIKEPIAKGLAIGTSSHAMGTTKAMEMGEIEGAMSSLAIVVTGILTVITTAIFTKFI
ncbi:MAG TPA: LrgB family protein [Lachnospiraceae bacterium]|nr:LrgB family protein [Lachnospiraceae bacterium]